MAVVVAQLVERVASNTRCTRFVSSHRKIYIKHLFFVNCFEKTKIKKKRTGMAYF